MTQSTWMNKSKTIKELKVVKHKDDQIDDQMDDQINDIDIDEAQMQKQSETYEQMINKITGKKVLFIDLETTGFPLRQDKSMPGGYADYKMNDQYDTSRIIQIGWYYSEKWNKNFEPDIDSVRSLIRKPMNFKTMNPKSLEIHGISIQRAIEHGTEFPQILNGEFGKQLNECDYIIGYNVNFDFSILANEIHRVKNVKLCDKIQRLKDRNVLCMMMMCKSYYGKILSQEKMYKELYHVDPLRQHDAKNDVFTMLKILSYICKNPKIKEIIDKDQKHLEIQDLKKKIDIIEAVQAKTNGLIQDLRHRVQILEGTDEKEAKKGNKDKDPLKLNHGRPWNQEEEQKLKTLYIDQNMSIKDIALAHGRTYNGIRSRLKNMNLLKDSNKSNDNSSQDSHSIDNNNDNKPYNNNKPNNNNDSYDESEEEEIKIPRKRLFN